MKKLLLSVLCLLAVFAAVVPCLADTVNGVLADEWKEYFYCDALAVDVLMEKGAKRVNSNRSSNTKASDNIISNGSMIAVNEGQFMIIVEQGAIVDLRVLDHLVVTEDRYFSFQAEGML